MEAPYTEIMDHLGALKELIFVDPARAQTRRVGASMIALAPKRLRPRHRQVVMLHELGYSGREIGEMTGYSEPRVSIILSWRGPEIDEYRHQARNQVIGRTLDVADRIALHAGEMLDIMVDHARKTTDATNSRLAARDILHMAGYSPVKRVANLHANVQVPYEIQQAVEQLDKFQEVQAKEDSWRVIEPQPKQLKDGTNG